MLRSLRDNSTIQLIYGVCVRFRLYVSVMFFYFVFLCIDFFLPARFVADRGRIWRIGVRHLGKHLIDVLGIKIDADDISEYPQSAIFVSNHPSGFDAFILFYLFGPDMITVTGPLKMFAFPLNKLFRRMQVVDLVRDQYDEIHQNQGHHAKDGIAEVVAWLKKGSRVLIFPEGHIERLPQMHYVHTGAARMSILSGAPIVVTALVGLDRILIDSVRIRPGHVHVHFGPVMYPPKNTHSVSDHEMVEKMRDQIREEIIDLLPARYVPEYLRRPPTKKIGVFVDIDNTIYEGLSQKDWLLFLVHQGQLSYFEFISTIALLVFEKIKIISHQTLMDRVMHVFAGVTPERAQKMAHQFFQREAYKKIRPSMLYLLKDHAKQQHDIIFVTEAVTPLAVQFKKYFEGEYGLHGIIATELEEKNGKYTGRIGRLCHGEEKAYAIERYAHTHAIDLTKSYAYSDSFSDVPMLSVVGHGVAVNADSRLRKFARKHHFGILD